jgi:hypothetical protein
VPTIDANDSEKVVGTLRFVIRPLPAISFAPDKIEPDNPAATRVDGGGKRVASALHFEIPRAPRFP